MVYDAEAVLPCDIIHDSTRVRMYEERERPILIGRIVQMPWRRSATLQKPVLHSINNKLADINAERCGPRLIMLVNSFYAYQKRKRTSSSPSGRVPSS